MIRMLSYDWFTIFIWVKIKCINLVLTFYHQSIGLNRFIFEHDLTFCGKSYISRPSKDFLSFSLEFDRLKVFQMSNDESALNGNRYHEIERFISIMYDSQGWENNRIFL